MEVVAAPTPRASDACRRRRSHDERKWRSTALRHRRNPRRRQRRPDDGGDRPRPRARRRARLSPKPAPTQDPHRQGHPAFGLHARAGDGFGHLLDGRRRAAGRAAADAGHRLSHAQPARRRRGRSSRRRTIPFQDNGIKFFAATGFKLPDERRARDRAAALRQLDRRSSVRRRPRSARRSVSTTRSVATTCSSRTRFRVT